MFLSPFAFALPDLFVVALLNSCCLLLLCSTPLVVGVVALLNSCCLFFSRFVSLCFCSPFSSQNAVVVADNNDVDNDGGDGFDDDESPRSRGGRGGCWSSGFFPSSFSPSSSSSSFSGWWWVVWSLWSFVGVGPSVLLFSLLLVLLLLGRGFLCRSG